LFAMRDGHILASGAPQDVVTPALIDEVFGLDAEVISDPVSHTPLVIPRGRHHASGGQSA
ncbi:MAG: ABC transporter ATP-binding protein, partial [Microbacterium gubbeenense]